MNAWILLGQAIESVILSTMVRVHEKEDSKEASSASETTVLRQELLIKQALIEQQSASIEQRDQRIRQLEELIRSFKQQRFGASSEKLSPDQLGLFNEAEEQFEEAALTETEVKPHTRRSRGRPALPDDLPREEIIYDLDEADKICPRDGAALKLIGEETSEQLEIIPATVKVIRHIRLKYACPCCDQHVATAAKPKQPLGKSIAGPGLLAYIATSKYQDALPLYRQNKIFERLGVNLDRTTLANWMIRCGELVQPLINLMTERILEEPWIHMDETPVQVLKEPGKSAQSKSYMWVLGGGSPGQRSVVFRYDPGRSGAVPTAMLDDYQGALMADGYSGYEPVCKVQSLLRLGCWTHA
jgi:transposase